MPLGVGDVVRVSARFSLAEGQDHVNVHYYECATAIAATDASILSDIEVEMGTAYSNLNPYLTNTADPVDVKVDEVQFIGGLEKIVRNLGTIPWTTAIVPGATGDHLPAGNAALVKFLTGIGKVYGRKFIGMMIEGHQQGGYVQAALLAALETFAAVILAGIAATGGGTLIPGVMSKRQTAFVAFTTYDVPTNIAYQRRRRPGTGG